jgi:hypothetical protein
MSSGVEFDEDKYGLSSRPQTANPVANSGLNTDYTAYQAPKGPPMIRWLMNHKLAKTESGANAILVGIVIINIIITVTVILYLV